jgi:putative DNA primase/helicase
MTEILKPHQAKTRDEAVGLMAAMTEADAYPYRKGVARDHEISTEILDKLVRDRRRQLQAINSDDPFCWEIEPAPREIDGRLLLDEVETTVRRHAIVPKESAAAIALWIMYAWVFDAFDTSPILTLVSPEKRCGKTRVIGVVTGLTPRALGSSNLSSAVVYRAIEEHHPTLIIDEGDSFMDDKDDLRGILNSGHTRWGASVLRIVEVGGEHKMKAFSTWAPKCIARIGNLPDTLADRSVIVPMKRKTPDEKVEKIKNPRQSQSFLFIRRMLARWAADNQMKLPGAPPSMPKLNDRAADNWEVLISIADLVGGDWPTKAREAAVVISGGDAGDSESVKTTLLSDINDLFKEQKSAKLFSSTIVDHLASMDDRPWPEWKNGKAMTKVQLARMLKPFKIKSKTVRIGMETNKGYELADFEDTFTHYLQPDTPSETSQRHNPQEGAVSGQNGNDTQNGCDVSKTAKKPASIQHCDVVTDKKGVGVGEEREEMPPPPDFLKRPAAWETEI